MKTAFSYNLLKHLRNKKEEGGFTLIELLVVIIIIGILAAIALPSFLNQANRARESEATNYLGSANRGQQAYFLERLKYADSIDNLDVGIEKSSDNFNYGNTSNDSDGNGEFTLTTNDQEAVLLADPKEVSLKGFASGIGADANQNETSIICRTNQADGTPAGVTFTDQVPACDTGDTKVGG